MEAGWGIYGVQDTTNSQWGTKYKSEEKAEQ